MVRLDEQARRIAKRRVFSEPGRIRVAVRAEDWKRLDPGEQLAGDRADTSVGREEAVRVEPQRDKLA